MTQLIDRLQAHLQAGREEPVERIETHISWVLLAGATAYKLKKPVRLPFLDFSSLDARRHFCEEEVQLNRRLAGSSLYLGVSRVTGTVEQPEIDGAGPTIDYAVRMRRFPAGSLLADHALAGTLRAEDIDRLAERLAAFHAGAAPVAAGSGYGGAAGRAAAASSACNAVQALLPERAGELQAVGRWLRMQAAALAAEWSRRQASGAVRECHGDLHLANLLLLDDQPTAFDAIEFDAALRCIDVVDDAAFVAMDLMAHGRRDLAFRFINGWLDGTGDHDGLPLWRHAMAYRALVRAQVALLRERQRSMPTLPVSGTYVDLAVALAAERPDARLLITHGLPGSGKSFVAQRLAEAAGAIRLRSDVERKRLFGLRALDDSGAAAPAAAVYGAAATRRTYERLAERAGASLRAGWPTIVDAAFLRSGERRSFARLAARLQVPFAILACEAPAALLRERVQARRARRDDPSEADVDVLRSLQAVSEPLDTAEEAVAAKLDTRGAVDIAGLASWWRSAPVASTVERDG